jgi:predicted nuclease of predicted toxin-antitoxin system
MRILVTFDKDFGDLAFRAKPPVATGIVLFRVSPRSPSYVARLAVRVLESRTDWTGHFSVVEENSGPHESTAARTWTKSFDVKFDC